MLAAFVVAFGTVACSDPEVEDCVNKVAPIQSKSKDFDIDNLRDTCKKMKELSRGN